MFVNKLLNTSAKVSRSNNKQFVEDYFRISNQFHFWTQIAMRLASCGEFEL